MEEYVEQQPHHLEQPMEQPIEQPMEQLMEHPLQTLKSKEFNRHKYKNFIKNRNRHITTMFQRTQHVMCQLPPHHESDFDVNNHVEVLAKVYSCLQKSLNSLSWWIWNLTDFDGPCLLWEFFFFSLWWQKLSWLAICPRFCHNCSLLLRWKIFAFSSQNDAWISHNPSSDK